MRVVNFNAFFMVVSMSQLQLNQKEGMQFSLPLGCRIELHL
jgi:hypothetical protein